MKLNFTKKFIIFVETIVLVVILFGGTITFVILQSSLNAQIHSQLESISLLKINSVNLYLKTGITELEYMANSEKEILSYLEKQNKNEEIKLREDFNAVVVENKALSDISILDKNGKILISSHLNDEGKIKSNESFFQKARDKTVIQNYYFDVISNHPAMFIATPIKDSQGKFVGEIIGDVSVNDINDIVVSRSGLGNTGETFIVNSFNMVVTDLLKEQDSAFRKTIYSKEIKDCLSGNSISKTSLDYHNDTVVGHYSWFPELKSCMVTKIDTSEALLPVKRATIIFVIVISILGVILGIISFIGSRMFIGPLKKLRDQIIRIKDGDFNANVNIKTKDEIGEMATIFNDMAQSLSRYKTNIETEVVGRTIELNDKVSDLEKTKKAVVNLLEDIEVEKKISENQADDLKKFKLVLENTSQHVIITNPEGVIIYANPAVEKITGYSKDEVIGNRPSLWGRQMPADFYEKMWAKIKDDKETFSGEIQNKRKNGEVYTAKSIISPVIGDNGEIEFFVGIETDISKEKALEKAVLDEKESVERKVIERTKELKEERARLLSSINSIPFGFIISDNKNNIILKNKVMMEIFNFGDGQEFSIANITALLGKEFNLETKIKHCASHKKICELHDVLLGSKIYRGIIAPIIVEEESNENIGYVFLLEDITEAKVMERSKDEFFAVASHELRTPLTAIRGNSSMLLDMCGDKMENKDMHGMIADINEASKRLIGIVNDFLDVSRLEQGKIEIKNKKFELYSVIDKVMDSVKGGVDSKKVKLKFNKGKDKSINIFADEEKVEQVLFNLVGNSIKFTPKGEISVNTKVSGNFVKISVSDTGAGISVKNESLLFRKFQPAGEQVLARDVTKSTGLGLYISQLLVSKMGGTIGLEKSVLGEGSTFFFTLPLNPLE